MNETAIVLWQPCGQIILYERSATHAATMFDDATQPRRASHKTSLPRIYTRATKSSRLSQSKRLRLRTAADSKATTPLPRQRAQVRPRTAPKRPKPTQSGTPLSLSMTNFIAPDYVDERLMRSIHRARQSQQHREAVRLQIILIRLRNQKITAIQAARDAWLTPAATNPT